MTEHEAVVECAYCLHSIPADHDAPPDLDAGVAWGERATEHAEWCEWIETRAHSITD